MSPTYDCGQVIGRRLPLLRFAPVRARLRVGALLLAVCQLMLVVTTTAVLASRASAPPTATVSADDDCTCEHSAGVMCPMHRPSKTSSAKTRPAPSRTLRSFVSCEESASFVVPGYGALAPPESIQRAPQPAADAAARVAFAQHPARVDSPPDFPPPRA
jgi:hypothetical protein